jgi:flagellar basal-body rod protein FlgF
MNIEKIAGAAMAVSQLKTSAISHNLANVSTPGFKSTTVSGGEFALRVASATTGPQIDFIATSPTRITINTAAGSMTVSHAPTDISVEGDSWLELLSPTGALYTRAGRLQVDRNGTLVGPGELPINSESGRIQLSGGKFSVNGDGEVSQNDVVVARLKRVRFENPAQLVAQGGSLYAQGEARIADGASGDSVRVGGVEASNVNSAAEMMRLTETVRHFESLQRIVQGYDEILEKTITKLGEF